MKLPTHALAKLLKFAPGAAMLGGGALAAHGAVSQIAAATTARDAIRNAPVEPYWKLKLTGRLPLTAKVLTDKDEMADWMLRASGVAPDHPHRAVLRRICLQQAEQFARGDNAGVAGYDSHFRGKWRRPVIFGPEKGMNPVVAAHETGHTRAAAMHGHDKYTRNYMRGMTRIPRPGDMLRRNMWNDEGAMSVPAVEAEAWQLAPGSIDEKLKDTALRSYTTRRTGQAELTYGSAAVSAMAVLRALLKLRRH